MKSHRIPVTATSERLQSPFAALQIEGLPAAPECPPPASEPEKKSRCGGRVILRREKAQRSGKTVVLVSGFAEEIPTGLIEELARDARHHCGCGGTVREREIELQGDQPDRVRQFFLQAGFRVAGV